jgi:hypothetical protein
MSLVSQRKASAAAAVAVLLSTQSILAMDAEERKKSLENCDGHLARCAAKPCPETVKSDCEHFCAAMSVGCEALRKGDDATAGEYLSNAQAFKDQAKRKLGK